MNIEKIVDYTLIAICFIFSVFFYVLFDLENILWDRFDRPIISTQDIEFDRSRDYTGYKAGEDIPNITNKDEWDDLLNDIDYARITPKSIVKTDVYSRANWIEAYTRKSNGATGRRLSDVRKSPLDISANYSPYYIIELEDGTHILAQMNRGIADKISKGQKVELPLGQKRGLTNTAKKLLKETYDEYDVITDHVFYTIRDSWEAEQTNRIMIEKAIISFVLFTILAVLVQLIVDKLIWKK